MRVTEMEKGRGVLRMPVNSGMLRPGVTVYGPTMMALADAAMYAALLSEIGPDKLAVTTSFNANFLRRPSPADLMVEATILKLRRRFAILDVTMFSDGQEGAIAHMAGTYSIPPKDQ